jgi:hypothetical protein
MMVPQVWLATAGCVALLCGHAAAETRPRIALIARVGSTAQTAVTFGSDAGDGGVVGRALARAVQGAGFELVAIGRDPVAATESADAPPQLHPLDQAAARQLAVAAGAAAAIVVGAEILADGPIRGTRKTGARARAAYRVIDQSGAVVAENDAIGVAAFGDSLELADQDAANRLAARLADAVLAPIERRWPKAQARAPQIDIDIRGASDWGVVRAIEHALTRTPGVAAVVPREFQAGMVGLRAATALGASRLARAVAQADLPLGTLSVNTQGEHRVAVDVVPAGATE